MSPRGSALRLASRALAVDPASAVWILVSFEGPDAYSRVGGLATRVTQLGEGLASLGFETHHFYFGEPSAASDEPTLNGRLFLHRWAQWLGRVYPRGPYDGECAKAAELAASLPGHVVTRIIRPAVDAGKVVIVLSEEWQTVGCACAIAEACEIEGLADHVAMVWNANAAYGLDRIDWARLARTHTITTVGERMRVVLRALGADAVVIPNGIPARLTRAVGHEPAILRNAFNGSRVLVKLSPSDHAAGWTQALDAIALLRDRKTPATLIAHAGGPNVDDGVAMLRHGARDRGLFAVEVGSPEDLIAHLTMVARRQPHVVILGFEVGEDLARSLSAAADAVLTNGVCEPFGGAGLAAMAVGGVVFAGRSDTDYPVSARNAVVLETSLPEELVWRLDALGESPAAVARIRRAARATARRLTWTLVIERLLDHAGRRVSDASASRATRAKDVRRGGRRTRGTPIGHRRTPLIGQAIPCTPFAH